MKATPAITYRAAIYLRLSKEDGDVTQGTKQESNSIANQKSLILDFLRSKPEIQVISVREDDGYSGVDFQRPAFQAMLEDIKRGDINCVVVKDLSRFGRNYIEVGRYLERLFPLLGVRFLAVNDNYDSLTADTCFDMVLPFKNLINDAYCRDLSVKIRSHLAVKRKNGEFLGAFACYGYLKSPEDKHRLVVDVYAGQVVQDIFRMFIHGKSTYHIARELNGRGILSPVEYKRSLGSRFETSFQVQAKATWSAKAVQRILTNEVYTGVLVQGKQTTPNHKIKVRQKVDPSQWVRAEKTHPPIIGPYLFQVVQTILGRDTRTAPKEDQVYPLSGLLFCGDCGHPMARKTSAYTVKRGGEARREKRVSYVCRNHAQTKCCSWHRTSEQALLDVVLQAVNLHIQHVLDMEQALKTVAQAPSTDILVEKCRGYMEKQQQERERAERLKLGAYEDYRDGLLDQEEYLKLRQEFDSRIQQADEVLAQLQGEMREIKNNPGMQHGWMEYFKAFGTLRELTRWAAVMTIDRILIYEDNRIRIVFNFQDEFLRARELLQGHPMREVV